MISVVVVVYEHCWHSYACFIAVHVAWVSDTEYTFIGICGTTVVDEVIFHVEGFVEGYVAIDGVGGWVEI